MCVCVCVCVCVLIYNFALISPPSLSRCSGCYSWTAINLFGAVSVPVNALKFTDACLPSALVTSAPMTSVPVPERPSPFHCGAFGLKNCWIPATLLVGLLVTMGISVCYCQSRKQTEQHIQVGVRDSTPHDQSLIFPTRHRTPPVQETKRQVQPCVFSVYLEEPSDQKDTIALLSH